MNDCKGIFGKLFGHKFKGFYSEKREPGSVDIERGSMSVAVAVIEANTTITKTFVKTQCVRCGEEK